MPRQRKKPEAKQEDGDAADEEQQQSGSKDLLVEGIDPEIAADLQRKLALLQSSSSSARDLSEAKQHNYKFWDTQPVPKLD
jgi:hypothetical protein